MSWSAAAIGRAPGVAAKVAAEFERIASPAYNMDAAEKAVASKIGEAIATALADQDPKSVVEVSASGSMSCMSGGVSTPHTHSLTVTIQTKWNFIE